WGSPTGQPSSSYACSYSTAHSTIAAWRPSAQSHGSGSSSQPVCQSNSRAAASARARSAAVTAAYPTRPPASRWKNRQADRSSRLAAGIGAVVLARLVIDLVEPAVLAAVRGVGLHAAPEDEHARHLLGRERAGSRNGNGLDRVAIGRLGGGGGWE